MKPIKNSNSSGNYNEKDYQELLHDTIAVIESSRTHIAKQINMSVISSHWEIGKLLEERKLDSKHGSISKELMGHETFLSSILSRRYKTATACRTFTLET